MHRKVSGSLNECDGARIRDPKKRKGYDGYLSLIWTETHEIFSPSASCADDEFRDSFKVLLYGRKISAGQIFDQKPNVTPCNQGPSLKPILHLF